MRNLVVATVALALADSAAMPSAGAAAPMPPAAVAADQLTLPPPKAGRARPLVVVVADNAGAETTDFTIPYGVLKDAGVADVSSLSTGAGPVRLTMALTIRTDSTIDAFEAAEPLGADIVIVPAQMSPKDPRLAAWIRAQAAKGAVIVSICEGARVVANAGLLDGRRATSHWNALKSLEQAYPATRWVRDRRYVQDGPIISTTGVSASIPVSLALVEAIAGRAAAIASARRLGVADWSAAHRTADFHVTNADVAGAVGAMLAFWTHETVEIPIADGVDELGLALRADAWTRTFRSKVVTTSAKPVEVRSRHGLTILPDAQPRRGGYVLATTSAPAAAQFDETLSIMRRRYGPAAVRLATLGMEYPTATRAQYASAR